MRKMIINSLISFSCALVAVSIIGYFVTVPLEVKLRDVKKTDVDEGISKSIAIKDKVVIQKTVNNANYLNAWKLSATIIANPSLAMVLRGRDSRILRIKDELEGYEVKKILKEKILFSTTTDDIWLYIKSEKVNINNPTPKIKAIRKSFTIRKRTFGKTIAKPEVLLKTINIVPDMKGNKFNGLKVISLLEGSFLYRYGLRKGDLIKKINGKNLLSIADGISSYQNILSSNRFSISVLRDNKIEEFKYEVR